MVLDWSAGMWRRVGRWHRLWRLLVCGLSSRNCHGSSRHHEPPNDSTLRPCRRMPQQPTWCGIILSCLPDCWLTDVSCDLPPQRRLPWFSSVLKHMLRMLPISEAHYSCFSFSCRCLNSLQLIPFFQTPPKYFTSLCLSLINSKSNLCSHNLNP